jgi:hypothetical protein
MAWWRRRRWAFIWLASKGWPFSKITHKRTMPIGQFVWNSGDFDWLLHIMSFLLGPIEDLLAFRSPDLISLSLSPPPSSQSLGCFLYRGHPCSVNEYPATYALLLAWFRRSTKYWYYIGLQATPLNRWVVIWRIMMGSAVPYHYYYCAPSILLRSRLGWTFALIRPPVSHHHGLKGLINCLFIVIIRQ